MVWRRPASPAPQFAIAHCGRNLKRRRMGDRRRLTQARRHWPARAQSRSPKIRPSTVDEAARRRRRYLRRCCAPPRPSSSAIAPPCTAPTSSSRVMRPRSTSTMRLATSSTSSRFCSTISIDRRCFSRRLANSSPISWTIDGWIPSDGSSSRRSHGSGTSARASARICCSPPDSAPPLRSKSRVSRGKIASTLSIARSSVSPESGVHARRRFSWALRPGRMPRPCGT